MKYEYCFVAPDCSSTILDPIFVMTDVQMPGKKVISNLHMIMLSY